VARYAAFLRGVNLGAKRKTPSAELREAFEAIGFDDVATFRTSGNVVFSSTGRRRESGLTKAIEAGLEDAFGFEIQAFLRSDERMRGIAAHDPFGPGEAERSGGTLQVDLLRKEPTAAARREVLSMATDDDRLAIDGRELYWLPHGGTLTSELDLRAIERLIGPTTRRTMGTIAALTERFLAG
jgi:uncharacterized protein (DUF1697 family)